MTQQKANRIAAAVTVNVILLIVVLVVVVICQIVQISVISKRRAEMAEQINRYTEQMKEAEDDLEYLKSEQGLRDLAFDYGYRYPD